MLAQYIAAVIALFTLVVWLPCNAQPMHLDGKWFQPHADWVADNQHDAALTSIEQASLTGGRFVYRAEFDVGQEATLVLWILKILAC